MIVTTGNEVPGHLISTCMGIVRGIVVRSPKVGEGFRGSFRTLIGGHNEPYTQVCETAREEAYQRMIQHAKQLGADAIIAVRYDSSPFEGGAGCTEVLVYGTAVKLASG